MQVIKSKTVVKLSMQELEDAVRRYVDSKEGLWVDEMEIELDGEVLKAKDFFVEVNEDYETGSDDTYGWKFVPPGWDKEEPPEELEPNTKVNVVFRDLSTDYNRNTAYLDFSQSGHPFDIIRYQLIK